MTGTNYLNETGVRYNAQELRHKPDFDFWGLQNDVGIILLGEDIVYGPKVGPIGLSKRNITEVDYPAILSGWGRLEVHKLMY